MTPVVDWPLLWAYVAGCAAATGLGVAGYWLARKAPRTVAVILAVIAVAVAAGWAGKANAASKSRTWHTCTRFATRLIGGLEYHNDHFAGARGPSCITVRNGWVTIDRNYRPRGGAVVAYDAIQFGRYPWLNDSAFGLPAPVGKVHTQLRATARGGPGTYLYDADVWFSRTSATGPLHHIREMVIANRSQGSWNTRIGRLVKIGRRRWHVSAWMTGQGTARHLLIRFIARHQTPNVTIRLAAFLRIARRHHWIGKWMTVDSASYAPECRGGCRHLTYRMTASPGGHR